MIQSSELEIVRKLGEGTTADVHLGTLRGVPVAVKEIRALNDDTDLATIQAVQRELRVLSNVTHPNIVRFIGLVTETFPLRFVLEYCEGGSLFELLHNNWQIALSWPQRLKMMLDTAAAEAHLHSFDPPIMHRDLKSLNLMLLHPVKNELDSPIIKLADFGFARIEDRAMTQGVGTKHWMAPEVLKGTEYTTKADVFSFAMVAFEVAFRQVPFERLDAHNVARCTLAGVRPNFEEAAEAASEGEVPPALLDVITECWHQDPELRPSFEEVHLKLDLLAASGAT